MRPKPRLNANKLHNALTNKRTRNEKPKFRNISRLENTLSKIAPEAFQDPEEPLGNLLEELEQVLLGKEKECLSNVQLTAMKDETWHNIISYFSEVDQTLGTNYTEKLQTEMGKISSFISGLSKSLSSINTEAKQKLEEYYEQDQNS